MQQSKEIREALADQVVDAAVKLIRESSETRDVLIGDQMFFLRAARVGGIQLLYMPPAALGFHVVYIWAPIEGRITRVFSAQWRPFHVVTFRYGPWTDLLLSGSGGPMMDAPTYPIELDYEEYILWLEDISRHDYVRELLAFSASRAQPFKLNELGHSLIGYSTVRSGTPREKPSGLYVRRAFVLRIYDDRSFQPNGEYRDNAPSEAVDPRTVAPGRPGLKTERVTGGGQRAPRPTQEMSGRDGTD